MTNLAFMILLSVQAMGDDRFVVRQGGSAVLEVCGRAAQPWLEMAVRSDDPEVSYRASALLCKCRRIQAGEFAGKRLDPFPWIDMLDEDLHDTPLSGNSRSEIVEQWLREVQAAFSVGPPDWMKYREATKLMVTEMIAQGVSEESVGDLLHRMQEREKEWWKQQRKSP